LPAMQDGTREQHFELKLVEPKKLVQAKPAPSRMAKVEDIEDMWDNMPV